jgi:hypothetical protein
LQTKSLSADYTDWKNPGEEFLSTDKQGFTQIIEKEDVLFF